MSFLVGQIVGGFLAVLIVAIIWEKVVFQRLADDPLKGKLLSVGAGWLTVSTLGGFGMADGGPYRWEAFTIYGLPALLVGLLAYRCGAQLRHAE